MCLVVLVAGFAAGPAGAEGGGPRAGASIISGQIADFSQWPFTVAILRKGRLHCGGSVIAPTKILTAAHCALGFSTANLSVVTGRARISDGGTGELIGVSNSVVHPDYATNGRHDVSVLTLESPTSAPPIALADASQSAAATGVGAPLRVAGWGARSPLGFKLSDVLRTTVEKVRTNKRCRRSYRSLFSGASMICALGKKVHRGYPPIHTSACSGDSGGPLVADTGSGPIEVGTVSYGSSICGYSGSPTVYSRVSDSLGFIDAQL
jgi:secreted trypsin-like serine protease